MSKCPIESNNHILNLWIGRNCSPGPTASLGCTMRSDKLLPSRAWELRLMQALRSLWKELSVLPRVSLWVVLPRSFQPLWVTSSQDSWRVKFALMRSSMACQMVSRRSLPMIRPIKKWSFPFVGMEDIEGETGRRTSSERVSGTPRSRARDWRERWGQILSMEGDEFETY